MSNFTLAAGFLSTVAFFYCFVFVDRNGKGIQAKIKRFLYEGLPNAIKAGLRATLGERAVWCVERSQSWLCFEANPLIQIFYLVLAVGGYYMYVVYGFCHIPNPYVSEFHKYIAWPLMFSCYWSYYKACSTNPGYLNKKTPKARLEHSLKRYEYDNIMFAAESWCETCDIPKPARSKHCSLCNVCCERFDHHCVWINACVGLHNYKYFILFLFLHAVICIYGTVIGYYISLHLIDELDLWNKSFYNQQGQKFQADFWIILQYLNNRYEFFAITVFLCFIVTIMLLAFLGYHTYLISRNLTTNEQMKRV